MEKRSQVAEFYSIPELRSAIGDFERWRDKAEDERDRSYYEELLACYQRELDRRMKIGEVNGNREAREN